MVLANTFISTRDVITVTSSVALLLIGPTVARAAFVSSEGALSLGLGVALAEGGEAVYL